MTRRKLPSDSTIYHLYWGKEMSLQDIANKYGVTKGAVHQVMVGAEIPRRPPQRAQRLALEKKGVWHSFRRDIMESWTSDSAYFLGIYIAGGTNNVNTLFLYFRNWQYDLANRVSNLLNSDKPPENWTPGFRLIYSSKRLVSKLIEIEDKLRQGLDVIPENYLPDFANGFLNRAAIFRNNKSIFFNRSLIAEPILERLGVILEKQTTMFTIDLDRVPLYVKIEDIPKRS